MENIIFYRERNGDVYPEHILKMIRKRNGLDEADVTDDDEWNSMDPQTVFCECCEWNGLLGYGLSLLGLVQDVFGIDLDECVEMSKKRRELDQLLDTL